MAVVGSVTGLLTKTGVGGLSSGMDIDALVTKMTAASRQKITNQEKSLQTLEWKQTAYRSVTKALTEFRDKYMNALSSTNFKSTALYNTIRASVPTETKAFTATAQSNAVSGKAYVNSIQQLATSQSVSSSVAMSKALETDITTDNLGEIVSKTMSGNQRDFMVTLDGVSRAVVIDDDFVKELKRIAYTYENSGTPPANDADRDAFDLYSVTDTDKQAQYLKDALQIRVNKLFENPPTKWADGTPVIGTPTSEDYLQMSSKITVTGTGSKIGFEAKDNSKLVLGYATSPASVSDTDQNGNPVPKALYDAAVEEMHKNTGLGALGFTKGASNKIDIYSSVASLAGKLVSNLSAPNPTINPADGTQTNNYRFIINDVSITVNDGESVSSFMNKVNSSAAGVTITYSEVTDKFTLTSKTQGEGQNIVMGDVNGNLLSALGLTLEKDRMGVTVSGGNDYADPMVYGKNAIAFIDGEKIERTSNEFTVNGVAYSLKDIYNYIPNYDSNDPPVLLNPPGSGAAKPSSPTSGTAVTLAPDATDLLKTVKDFVSDYNALVDLLYGLNNEEKYTDYEPLTEEERAAMSESQIKMWEDKAKSGLLRGDSTLGKILTSMRQAFLTTSGNFGLFSMGITYGSYSYKDNGKLQITDEAMLKSALESRPDQVRDLFTNASKGAITKLDKVIDDAVRTTGGAGYRGSLIEMAGLPSSLSEKDNAIYTQILNHNKRINMFKDLLEKEESRLWTKFSAMESALAKLNEQNNMISQYLGTGTKQ